MGRCTIGPASFGLGDGRDVLLPSLSFTVWALWMWHCYIHSLCEHYVCDTVTSIHCVGSTMDLLQVSFPSLPGWDSVFWINGSLSHTWLKPLSLNVLTVEDEGLPACVSSCKLYLLASLKISLCLLSPDRLLVTHWGQSSSRVISCSMIYTTVSLQIKFVYLLTKCGSVV
jgi:hypothetical protein